MEEKEEKKKKGDNQGEEEIVALVKESAEKCKKCERNILSNIDAFNSEIFDDTEDKNNNGLVRGRRRRRRRGRSCFATRSEIRAGFERNGSGFRICGGRRADKRGNEF